MHYLILSDCKSRTVCPLFQVMLVISLSVAFLMRCLLMMQLREMSEPGLKNLSGGRVLKVSGSG